MEDVLIPIAVIGTMAYGIISFTTVLTQYFLRKRMIDKGLVGEDAATLLQKQKTLSSKYASLKWGLIILFGGIGFVVAESFGTNQSLMGQENWWESSAMPYGILAVCISLGFLIYYFIVRNKLED